MKPLDFKVSGFSFFGDFSRDQEGWERGFGFDLFRGSCPGGRALYHQCREGSACPIGHGTDQGRPLPGRHCQQRQCQCLHGESGAERCQEGFFVGRKELGIGEKLVFPSSTGVIGSPLPVKKIEERIPELIETLSPEGWMKTVEAIMTTDTFPKVEVATCRIKGKAGEIMRDGKGCRNDSSQSGNDAFLSCHRCQL